MRMRLLRATRRSALRKDLGAGAVLGLVSVPDGLASGLLAGVNPASSRRLAPWKPLAGVKVD